VSRRAGRHLHVEGLLQRRLLAGEQRRSGLGALAAAAVQQDHDGVLVQARQLGELGGKLLIRRHLLAADLPARGGGR
jgi:hypothetical protein